MHDRLDSIIVMLLLVIETDRQFPNILKHFYIFYCLYGLLCSNTVKNCCMLQLLALVCNHLNIIFSEHVAKTCFISLIPYFLIAIIFLIESLQFCFFQVLASVFDSCASITHANSVIQGINRSIFVSNISIFVNWSCLLSLINIFYFYLSPCKKTVRSIIFRNIPPESSFDESSYHVRIISAAKESLERSK